jgi:hypothetical protein
MKRFALLAVVACLCGCALTGTARADRINVDFTYTGSGFNTPVNGTGSFSFASNLTTVTLSDLSSFNFSDTATVPPPIAATYNFTYGLSDLTSFSANVSPGPSLTLLALATDFVAGTTTNPSFPHSPNRLQSRRSEPTVRQQPETTRE